METHLDVILHSARVLWQILRAITRVFYVFFLAPKCERIKKINDAVNWRNPFVRMPVHFIKPVTLITRIKYNITHFLHEIGWGKEEMRLLAPGEHTQKNFLSHFTMTYWYKPDIKSDQSWFVNSPVRDISRAKVTR